MKLTIQHTKAATYRVNVKHYKSEELRRTHYQYFETGAELKIGLDISTFWRTYYLLLVVWKEAA